MYNQENVIICSNNFSEDVDNVTECTIFTYKSSVFTEGINKLVILAVFYRVKNARIFMTCHKTAQFLVIANFTYQVSTAIVT